MTWNYRIVEVPYNGHPFYYLHEIYYNEDGERDGRTANPVTLAGYDDLEEMKQDCVVLTSESGQEMRVYANDTGFELLAQTKDGKDRKYWLNGGLMWFVVDAPDTVEPIPGQIIFDGHHASGKGAENENDSQ